jgi:hypothetical protein
MVSIGSPATDFTNTGTILLSGTDSRLALAGTMSVASLGSVVVAGGWLELDGSLDNTGNTLTLGSVSGFTGLQVNGVLQGGTVDNQGGTLAGNGHLDDVAWRGALALAALTSITIDHGLTLQPVRDGRAVIDLANDSWLRFLESATLADADLTAHGSAGISSDGALTVTADTIITADFVSGGALRIPYGTVRDLVLSGSSVTNNGVIQANSGTNGQVVIRGAFVNAGTVAIAGAGNGLVVRSGGFINSRSVVISNGATLELDAGPTVEGGGLLRIADAASALALGGSFTTASLARFDLGAGQLQVLGTLDNSATTISVGADAACCCRPTTACGVTAC